MAKFEDTTVYSDRNNNVFSDEALMSHEFWINDLIFAVPPEQIQAQGEDTIFQWQSLRTSNTVKVHGGKGSLVFSVKCTLPSKQSIVNIDIRETNSPTTINYGNNSGKRGGLVDFILQFKNIPFARVENAFIRSKLRIPEDANMVMCMHQMNVTTVPGEPDSLDLSFVMTVFNYSPYSDKWLFKDDWVTKAELGFRDFESVNTITLPDRTSYRIYTINQELASVPAYTGDESTDLQVSMSPEASNNRSLGFYRENGSAGLNPDNEIFSREFDINFTEGGNDRWNTDLVFMNMPTAVKNPSQSAIFKTYCDWLFSEYANKMHGDGEVFDHTLLGGYNSDRHDIGDSIEFQWKEYKRFAMPNGINETLRQVIRDRLLGLSRVRDLSEEERQGLQYRYVSREPVSVPQNEENNSFWNRTVSLIEEAEAETGVVSGDAFIDSNNLQGMIELVEALVLRNRSSFPNGLERGVDLEFDSEAIASEIISSSNSLGVPALLILIGCLSNRFNPWAKNPTSSAHGMGDQLASIARLYMDRNYRQPAEAMIPALEPGQSYNDLSSEEANEILDVMYRDPAQQIRSMARHIATIIGYQRNNSDWRILGGQTLGGESRPVKAMDEVMATYAWGSSRQARLTRGLNYLNTNYLSRFQLIMQVTRDLERPELLDDILGQYESMNNSLPEPTNSDYSLETYTPEEPETDSIPVTLGGVNVSDVGPYIDWVASIEAQGWRLYRDNLTVYDVFYRDHSLTISCSNNYMDLNSAPIVCNFISASCQNIFSTIPISGSPYPTAQYLGKRDDQFLVTFQSVGLNNLKKINSMHNMLRKQAIQFKYILDSWSLKVKNNLINCFGDRSFIINSIDDSTVPGSPDLYSTELRLVANPIYKKDSKLSYVGVADEEAVKRSFLKELTGNGVYANSLLRIAVMVDFSEPIVLDDIEAIRRAIANKEEFVVVPRDLNSIGISLPEAFRAKINRICGQINRINRLFKVSSSRVKPEFLETRNGTYFDISSINRNFIPNDPLDTTVVSIPDLFELQGSEVTYIFRQGNYLTSQLYLGRIGLRYISPSALYSVDTTSSGRSTQESIDFYFEEEDVNPRSRIAAGVARLILGEDQSETIKNYLLAYRPSNIDDQTRWTLESNNARSAGTYLTIREGTSNSSFSLAFQESVEALNENGLNTVGGYFTVNRAAQTYLQYCTRLEDLSSYYEGWRGEPFAYLSWPNWTYRGIEQDVSDELSRIAGEQQVLMSGIEEFIVEDPEGRRSIPFYLPLSIKANTWGKESRLDRVDLEYYRNSMAREYEEYIWEQVAIPHMVNGLLMSDILELIDLQKADGSYLFSETINKVQVEKVQASGPAYPDLMLPLHPYWNQDTSNNWGAIFTDPDFYMFNAGAEGGLEIPVIRSAVDSDNAYNTLTQIEAEYAIESIRRMSSSVDENEQPRFSTPFSARNLYEGASASFDMEFGYNSHYPPTVRDSSVGTGSEQANQMGAGEILSEDGSGTLRNSRIDAQAAASEDPNEMINPWGSTEGSTDLGAHISHGMVGVHESLNQSEEEYVSWRVIAPMLGPNLELPQMPPNIDGNSLRNDNFWRYTDYETYEVINALLDAGSLNSTVSGPAPYNFRVDASEVDPAEDFLNGNWGAASPMDFSNNRLAMYSKIKDAMKSLGTKKWLARRAFPTYKVYFIEEDSLETQWVQYDDMYTYGQIMSIKISDSRKRPASTCEIVFLNVNGVLDGNNQYNKAVRENQYEPYRNAADSQRRQRLLNSEALTQQSVDTDQEQNTYGFTLEQGTKIKVKLGYSNNADRLNDVFLGEVAEVEFLEEGDMVRVICQSYGVELVAKLKGSSINEVSKTYENSFDLLAHLMFEPEVLHFGRQKINSISMIGRDQSLRRNQLIHRNTFGRRPVREFIKGIGNWILNLGIGNLAVNEATGSRGIWNGIIENVKAYVDKSLNQIRVSPIVGPQDDNIFVPNFGQIHRMSFFNFQGWDRNFSVDPITGIVRINNNAANDIGRLDYRENYNRDPVEEYTGQGPISRASFGNAEIADLNRARVNEASSRFNEESSNGDTARFIQRVKPWMVKYNIFYSTIWDVFEEMTFRHPGYIKHPVIYGNSNRMSMFFGLPDQRYWASEPPTGETIRANQLFNEIARNSRGGNNTTRYWGGGRINQGFQVRVSDVKAWMNLAFRRFKPFRKWHHINSITDIVSNQMIANKHGFYTDVKIQYMGSNAASKLEDALKAYQEVAGEADLDINRNQLVKYNDSNVEEVLAHRDLSPENIREVFHEFPNCRGVVMARRYGRSLLARYAREMYKGSIVMLGDASIKPYDVVIINDTYNDISGPIEVEEVIHMFTPETGFLTEIIPDTFIIDEDITPFVIFNSIKPTVALKTERYMENALFSLGSISENITRNDFYRDYAQQLEASIENNNRQINNALGLFEDLADAPYGAGLIGGSIATWVNPIAGGVIAATGALTSFAISSMGAYFVVNYVANRRAFIMCPLIKSGKPWVAGFELNMTNTMFRSMFGLMERWWDDGSEGVNLMLHDALLANQASTDRFGSELTMLARLGLGERVLEANIRRGLVRGLDSIAQSAGITGGARDASSTADLAF
jgi:hypothetical protein